MTLSIPLDTLEKYLDTILIDLKHVDREKLVNNIKSIGLIDSARILGYDISHYDNLMAAGRLLMVNLQENTPQTLEEYIELLEHRLNPETLHFMREHTDKINQVLREYRKNDYYYDFFSAFTMIKTYLAKPYYGEDTCETPQLAFMRIAIQFYYDEGIDKVIEVFKELSEHYYTPASPTIFSSGFKKPSLSSCFLSTIDDDIESILYTGVVEQGLISKAKGGIGMDLSRIRHSEIAMTGMSNGVRPFIRIYNEMVRAVDQMSMRKGAATLYLRPHHLDIYDFCDLPLKIGNKDERAHDVNIALWCPNLFFERLKQNGKWTLFCPAKTPLLNDAWGNEFERYYVYYEDLAVKREEQYQQALIEKKALDTLVEESKISRRDAQYKDVIARFRAANRQRIDHKIVDAYHLYKHIISVQRRAGMPYILHGDAANMKCNQKNLGYIRCSNLCLEIMEFSSADEIASCNLSSLSLRRFVKGSLTSTLSERTVDQLKDVYDFELLGKMTRSLIRNLNKVIDHNWYPLDKLDENGMLIKGKIRKSNEKHRPVGLGISGFAETLHGVDLTFEDPLTKEFNKMIFACIYFNALAESVSLAMKDGAYDSWAGSPFSRGELQFDLWKQEFDELNKLGRINPKIRTESDDIPVDPSVWGQITLELHNGECLNASWDSLKTIIKRYGTRNSLLTALMPTATTSNILRNAEGPEGHMSNIYSRKVISGAFPVVNRYMIWDLEKLGIWNFKTLAFIQADGGSIAKLDAFIKNEFPQFNDWQRFDYVKRKYKTMWELSQKLFYQLAADRGRYIDQSQSTNVYMADPTDNALMAAHLYGYQLGLKTGMYYLRQLPSVEPIKFTLDPKLVRYLGEIKLNVELEKDKLEQKEKEESCERKKVNGVECLSCQ
jgi:ribonucleoside-diphosphate reductase subunit M1